MKKRIVALVIAAAVVISLVASGTWALFTDTETSIGNTFSAGTIDIAIDDDNPWSEPFTIADAKPCETWYVDYVITNVGDNPCVIWKHLKDNVTSGGIEVYPVSGAVCSSEPEYVAGGGAFVAGVPDGTGYTETCNIGSQILYDLSVKIPDYAGMETQNQGMWSQVLYNENVTISTLWSDSVILGSLAPGGTMNVRQSYHLRPETPNDYQGDCLTFTVEFFAQQLQGTTAVLENKDESQNWLVLFGDAMSGTLDYNTVGSTFDYTCSAAGLQAGQDYSLIYYPEPQTAWPWAVTIIDSGVATGGSLSLSGSYDFGLDLNGAKIWLVLSSHVPGGMFTSWDSTKYLLDTQLIWHNDTDTP